MSELSSGAMAEFLLTKEFTVWKEKPAFVSASRKGMLVEMTYSDGRWTGSATKNGKRAEIRVESLAAFKEAMNREQEAA